MEGHRQHTALVFLPGRKDRAEVFEREGFFEAARRHGLTAELIAADAHTGYYVRGTLVRRLHNDVVEPARRRGDSRIILVGVSIGAYGAIRYAMAHPGTVSVLVLLSPFLGAGSAMREIAEAGDVDFDETWDWLKRYPKNDSAEQREASGYPRIILGYGREDLFLKTDGELRELLPPQDVLTAFGAHLWSTWRALFEELLDKDLLALEPSSATEPRDKK
jgi:pimeloyl-ACP methyl ester carboxylesterase